MVKHIVLFKLKDEAPADKKLTVNIGYSFSNVKGVVVNKVCNNSFVVFRRIKCTI